jgi:hypothetical protein
MFAESILVALTSMAAATEKVNTVNCMYYHRQGKWTYAGHSSFKQPLELKDKQTQMLFGYWTVDRPAAPNYAVCDDVTGTADDSSVTVRHLKFEGQVIDNISADCAVKGMNVKQTSALSVTLARGNFVETVSDWLISPAPDKISVRVYFPTLSEVDHVADIANAKCAALLPTTISE